MIKQILIYILIFLAGLTFPIWQKTLLLMIVKQKKTSLDNDQASDKELEILEENELKQLKTIKLLGRSGKQTSCYENDMVHISFTVNENTDDVLQLAKIFDNGKITVYSKMDGELVGEIRGGIITRNTAESSNSSFVYCFTDGRIFFNKHFMEKKLVPKD